MEANIRQFPALVTQQWPSMRRYAYHLTRHTDHADDLVQECVLKALSNQDKYHMGTDLAAWLRTLVKNTFINQYRRQRLTRKLEGDIDAHRNSVRRARSGDDPWSTLMAHDLHARLNGLPPDFRTAFTMQGQGFTYEEIAARTGVPIGTVKSRIHEARRQLRKACGPAFPA